MVFAILTVLLLSLEAKPLLETFDVSEDSTSREEPRHPMEEKRNKASLSKGTLRLTGSDYCRQNRYLPPFCLSSEWLKRRLLVPQ